MSNIIDLKIKDSMEQSYLDYAMSVITGRALPDVRDGLKPVHRRILYAMHESSNIWNRPYKKSARMVGDVIGKYHPHGDVSVYDAAARMTQPFSMNAILIDGQGNFGSIDGDNPAAMRYTEMRMSRLATDFFGDIAKETVEFRPNYDGQESEPTVLPVAFPNLLVNGTDGIAVGMATSILPHNLNAVIDATLHTMACQAEGKSPATAAEITDILKGPDFPTKAIVHGLDGFANAVEKGIGRIKVRSRWHEEDRGRGLKSLVITEIPFQIKKDALVARIAELVSQGNIAMQADNKSDIVNIQDQSDKDGIRIVIDLRKDSVPEVVFSELCAKTDVEDAFTYNCTVLVNGIPRMLGLMDIISEWITFRRDVVLKRNIFERKQAQARLHTLEGFMKALDMLDAVIATIRGAESAISARLGLIALLSIDESQAQAILDLKLQRLTGMEITSLRNEHQVVLDTYQRLTTIIESPALIDGIIRGELVDVKTRYGRERQTELGYGISEITREDLIPREEVIMMMTKKGYVKRIALQAFNRQARGTRGKKAMDLDKDDSITFLKQVHSHDSLLVFDANGRCYGIKSYRVPEMSLTNKARHIRNVIDGLDQEVTGMVMVPDHDDSLTVMTVSRFGTIKRSKVDDYAGATRRNGIQGVGFDEGDGLSTVQMVQETDHMILVANTGKVIRFPVSDVRTSGRTSVGVRGIRLDDGEFVVGSMVVPQGEQNDASDLHLFCIGDQGVGKRSKVSAFNVQSRGGAGVIGFKANAKTGLLVCAMGVTSDQDLMMLTSNGVTNKLAVSDVSVLGRDTSGARLMNVDPGQQIVSVTAAVKSLDEDELETDGASAAL